MQKNTNLLKNEIKDNNKSYQQNIKKLNDKVKDRENNNDKIQTYLTELNNLYDITSELEEEISIKNENISSKTSELKEVKGELNKINNMLLNKNNQYDNLHVKYTNIFQTYDE